MATVSATRLTQESTLPTRVCEIVETPRDLLTRAGQLSETAAESMALVTVKLQFEHEGKGMQAQHTSIEQSTLYFLQHLRPLVRKTDAVLLLNSTMHFLLFEATLQGGQLVQERLWEALLWCIHNSLDSEVPRPSSIAISHSASPHPCTSIEELLEATSTEQHHFDLHSEKSPRKTTSRSRPVQVQGQKPQEPASEDLPILARKLGVPYLSLLPRPPSRRVQQLVNRTLARELRCYPIGRERNTLTVAMLDPRDRTALDRLQQETGLCIFPVLTNPTELQTALEQLG